jgi:uncharacterized protein YceK
MVAKVIALTALLALGGCASMMPRTGSLCSVGPFVTDPGAAERLTRAEKEYQVTLNEAGAHICGWSPPKK